jgi:hypothetical protein
VRDIRCASGKIHVALIETPAIASGVHNTPWQQRLKAMGLTQKEFARVTGWTENTISRQMRGDWEMPRYVKAMILALGAMTPEQRKAWAAEVEKEC